MDSLIHLAPAGYLVVLAAVTVGSLVQGSVGFGANMVAAPVLAVVEPRALPAALMLPVLPLTVAMMRRERHGVDWGSVGWLMAGRVPGTVAGSLVVAMVAAETLSVLAGVAVLIAVGASLLTATVPVTPGTEVATGVVSGAMGTATSIGGPPLALLYQHHEGPALRATLAATFALGTGLSIVGLRWPGRSRDGTCGWPRRCCPARWPASPPATAWSAGSTGPGCAPRCWCSPPSPPPWPWQGLA